MPDNEWHAERALGRKWQRLHVTFASGTSDEALVAYLKPIAEKFNAARVINQQGEEIQVRRGRTDVRVAGFARGAYTAKVKRS